MAYQFYLAKLNQEKIRAQEHFETIHHTGARLTHDIKNILQSIKTSIDILDMDKETPQSQQLLQTNLNQISTRLESTLDKLRAPKLNTHDQPRRLSHQWIKRYRQSAQRKPTPELSWRHRKQHHAAGRPVR